jgi:ribosomal protein S18 acetylase RimI-like enzyme
VNGAGARARARVMHGDWENGRPYPRRPPPIADKAAPPPPRPAVCAAPFTRAITRRYHSTNLIVLVVRNHQFIHSLPQARVRACRVSRATLSPARAPQNHAMHHLRTRPPRPPPISRGLRCSCTASPADTAPSPPPPQRARRVRVRVRRAADGADVRAVAGVASAVFGGFEFTTTPNSNNSEQRPQLLTMLESRRAELVRKDVQERLSAALQRKREAQAAARALSLERRARGLRAALEAARLGMIGEEAAAAARPGAETRAEVRERERRRRDRAFAALLAVVEEDDDGEVGSGGGTTTNGNDTTTTTNVAGIATVSYRRPEAALPPPFPSSAPLRAYLSDMAVLPSARRSGCARLLLERACCLARRWGEDSLWLHVAEGNDAAVRLYEGAGFVRAASGGGGGAGGGAAVAAALAGLAARGGASAGPQVLMVRRL